MQSDIPSASAVLVLTVSPKNVLLCIFTQVLYNYTILVLYMSVHIF